ncbi:Bacterial regulatory proteins, lacI family [Serratia fonticola]|uniref:Bacterial regulatory proteins, lacI family n=1 Tax=Serratia fonticola TaxID=47917 RepID=A0A4U9WNS3_SERFO|nr:Bacterial regulatory proteins, lacI family [Serratia fonticola]
MTTGKKRETLKTIAETLNVTHTTVSNVFNRPEKVSPELREKDFGLRRIH